MKNKIERSHLWRDPISESDGKKPELVNMLISGKRGKILSSCYKAGGEGRHPGILLCHGFPGNEQQLDLAQALRRIGFHVVSFHYSGSWGSDGDYSISNCLEDAETVLEYMISHAELEIDTEKMVIIGHSLGGFVAAQTFARNPEIAAAILITPADLALMAEEAKRDAEKLTTMETSFAEGSAWLRGADPDGMIRELRKGMERWKFSSLAPRMAGRPLLLVGGSRDDITPPKTSLEPLADALEKLHSADFEYRLLQTDHYQSDARICLAEVVADFLDRRLL